MPKKDYKHNEYELSGHSSGHISASYHLDTYSFDGPIEETIELLTKIKTLAESDGYRNIKIDVQPEDYSDGYNFVVYGTRRETDKERDKRLAKAAKARADKKVIKAKKEATERAEYVRLTKKFEGT